MFYTNQYVRKWLKEQEGIDVIGTDVVKLAGRFIPLRYKINQSSLSEVANKVEGFDYTEEEMKLIHNIEYIMETAEKVNFNLAELSRLLSVSRTTAKNYLVKYIKGYYPEYDYILQDIYKRAKAHRDKLDKAAKRKRKEDITPEIYL